LYLLYQKHRISDWLYDQNPDSPATRTLNRTAIRGMRPI
jgi:hypothetical protein